MRNLCFLRTFSFALTLFNKITTFIIFDFMKFFLPWHSLLVSVPSDKQQSYKNNNINFFLLLFKLYWRHIKSKSNFFLSFSLYVFPNVARVDVNEKEKNYLLLHKKKKETVEIFIDFFSKPTVLYSFNNLFNVSSCFACLFIVYFLF